MQWIMLRRFVDFTLISGVIAAFSGCNCASEILMRFYQFGDPEKFGILVILFLAAEGILAFCNEFVQFAKICISQITQYLKVIFKK